MAGEKWSDAEVEALKKLCENDCTLDQLCTVLVSRTKTGILNKVYAMNLTLSGKPPEINMEAFKRLLKEGKPKCL